jgi:hypothetical protein
MSPISPANAGRLTEHIARFGEAGRFPPLASYVRLEATVLPGKKCLKTLNPNIIGIVAPQRQTRGIQLIPVSLAKSLPWGISFPVNIRPVKALLLKIGQSRKCEPAAQPVHRDHGKRLATSNADRSGSQ